MVIYENISHCVTLCLLNTRAVSVIHARVHLLLGSQLDWLVLTLKESRFDIFDKYTGSWLD